MEWFLHLFLYEKYNVLLHSNNTKPCSMSIEISFPGMIMEITLFYNMKNANVINKEISYVFYVLNHWISGSTI